MKKALQRFRISAPVIAILVLVFGSWAFDRFKDGWLIAAGFMIGYVVSIFFSETK